VGSSIFLAQYVTEQYLSGFSGLVWRDPRAQVRIALSDNRSAKLSEMLWGIHSEQSTQPKTEPYMAGMELYTLLSRLPQSRSTMLTLRRNQLRLLSVFEALGLIAPDVSQPPSPKAQAAHDGRRERLMRGTHCLYKQEWPQ
jgi:hypothetical protein